MLIDSCAILYSLLLRHRSTLLAGLGVLVVYASSLAAMPKHVFWMPDEGSKFMEMESVRWDSGVRYDVPFPSRRIDPRFDFLPDESIYPHPFIASSGRLYIGFETSVLFPLLSRLPFEWFGISGIYLIPLLSGLTIALLSGFLLWSIDRARSPFAVLLVGLGTPIWFYSMVFWEHTLGTCLAMLAVYTVAVSPRVRAIPMFVTSATLIAAAMFRIELLAFAAAVFVGWGVSVFAARRTVVTSAGNGTVRARERWAILLALAVVIAGLLGLFEASLALRNHKLLTILPRLVVPGLEQLWSNPNSFVEVFVNSVFGEGPVISSAATSAAGAALVACFLAAFATSIGVEAVLLLGGCATMLAFSGLLVCTTQPYRSLHGFFPVAPFVIVWPYSLAAAWRERNYALLATTNIGLCGLVTGLVAIAAKYIANGQLQVGMEWGQRYLLTLYPILTVATLAAIPAYWNSDRPWWLRYAFSAAVASLMIVGVWLEIRGLAMLRDTRQRLAVWDQAMRADGPIVTNVWWLPSAVSVLFTEHEMFYLKSNAELPDWLRLAAAHGVDRFTFAGLQIPQSEGLEARGFIRRVGEHNLDVLNLTSFELLKAPPARAP